jgi:Sec-independent protein secretion pathway component TatC
LARLGVADQHLLSKARKYVLVMNLLLSALVTGPEVVPQLLLFLVFQGMYELGVWAVGAVGSQRFNL